MAPVQLPVVLSEFPDYWDIWRRPGVTSPVEGPSPARKGGVAQWKNPIRSFPFPFLWSPLDSHHIIT